MQYTTCFFQMDQKSIKKPERYLVVRISEAALLWNSIWRKINLRFFKLFSFIAIAIFKCSKCKLFFKTSERGPWVIVYLRCSRIKFDLCGLSHLTQFHVVKFLNHEKVLRQQKVSAIMSACTDCAGRHELMHFVNELSLYFIDHG